MCQTYSTNPPIRNGIPIKNQTVDIPIASRAKTPIRKPKPRPTLPRYMWPIPEIPKKTKNGS